MNINVLGCNNVNIKIYDIQYNLLIDEYISNSIFLNLPKGIYIIKIFKNSNYCGFYVLLHKKEIDYFNLYPNLKKCNKTCVKTFFLYDYFYQGLKIQRGELILGT